MTKQIVAKILRVESISSLIVRELRLLEALLQVAIGIGRLGGALAVRVDGAGNLSLGLSAAQAVLSCESGDLVEQDGGKAAKKGAK